jgi:hypothetical protein
MLSLRFVMRRFIFVMLVFCSLLLSWLLALRLVILRLLVLLLLCHLPHLRLFLLLLVVRVVVFTVISVATMNIWHSATGRRKLKRLRLAALHRVLVLEDLRGVCWFRNTGDSHAASPPCGLYVVRSCWFCDSVLCTYRFRYYFLVFRFGTTFRSFSRY